MEASRSRAAELGREAVAIVEAGAYRPRSGRSVEIREAVAWAVLETGSRPPDVEIAMREPEDRETEIGGDESTLVAARRLVRDGRRAAAPNFASARSPGGGLLGEAGPSSLGTAPVRVTFRTAPRPLHNTRAGLGGGRPARGQGPRASPVSATYDAGLEQVIRGLRAGARPRSA